ncbi:isocitrate lyase/PEP mutase family protein [Mucilaginibacter jinjuensis]|uniref:Isocitrate lyase/PEP mutase family protein n=1 Tax=Mucilaginibacter jinjuensis TaxID=1176721 RepID=A0ABY7TAZ1_9SPHI|nr:isocitrate lyase/PEP mutase family protein [Mucilaginibacter jinjuensis]WCT13255.1 isocitrate lyase/PEP mutase family protein [Mucilaginibacter jinjuensis]
MKHTLTKRKSWKAMLAGADQPVQLPVAHDALTARLIELAGFDAYQIGGYALSGATHAIPDVDLEKFGEKKFSAEWIMNASPLPVLVDIDDGYGDVKNVTRTVQEYISLGASAIFMEDQKPPKKCGHMDDKKVIRTREMIQKIKAAVAARERYDFFILARTDAIDPEGLENAIDRAKAYLDAGADGAYLEGPQTLDQLEQIGKALNGVPLATSILEDGGKTPWVSPKDLKDIGFSMVLYPTTLIFQIVYTLQRALENLKHGKPTKSASINMDEFMNIVDLPYWKQIEEKFEGKSI